MKERGQRLGERSGEHLLVGPLGQLRLAQLDEQVDIASAVDASADEPEGAYA